MTKSDKVLGILMLILIQTIAWILFVQVKITDIQTLQKNHSACAFYF
jgi:hypothetical protein